MDHWEHKLRSKAAELSSLKYFKPEFMSLETAHPLWWTAGSNCYEIFKAVIQSQMLSGRYRTGLLCSKWKSANVSNSCPFPHCNKVESLEHILVDCNAYSDLRADLIDSWSDINISLMGFMARVLVSPKDQKVQFLLDPSCLPVVIKHCNEYGKDEIKPLFAFGRTWCYKIHKHRLKQLKSVQKQ